MTLEALSGPVASLPEQAARGLVCQWSEYRSLRAGSGFVEEKRCWSQERLSDIRAPFLHLTRRRGEECRPDPCSPFLPSQPQICLGLRGPRQGPTPRMMVLWDDPGQVWSRSLPDPSEDQFPDRACLRWRTAPCRHPTPWFPHLPWRRCCRRRSAPDRSRQLPSSLRDRCYPRGMLWERKENEATNAAEWRRNPDDSGAENASRRSSPAKRPDCIGRMDPSRERVRS